MTRRRPGFTPIELLAVIAVVVAPAAGPPPAVARVAAAPADEPVSVPLTRPELKQMLEDSKRFVPRLRPPSGAEGQGSMGLRNLLPEELRGMGSLGLRDGRASSKDMAALRGPNPRPRSGQPEIGEDPALTIDYTLRIELWWLVSRANNCLFCLGHQEPKLRYIGMPEERIAALDGDWHEFTRGERAVFSLARKMTREPQAVTDEDVAKVREFYTALQTAEIIAVVAGYNTINRWTGPLRLTQQDHHEYLSPTPEAFASQVSRVAPATPGSSGGRCAPMPAPRPALESPDEVEAQWARCRTRTPRVPLADPSAAREVIPADLALGDVPPNWARVLANFPKAGVAPIRGIQASFTKGRLDPTLKAKVAWASAREDRAWYALDLARRRLEALGVPLDRAFALDRGDSDAPPAEAAALAFARKLTADPALITDDDFASLRPHFSDAEVVELVHHINADVFFNRFTEACGLPLDPAAR